jgi:hypothetical protein
MSDTDEQELERMLRSRRFEPAGADLEERIILKAQRIPQNQAITLTAWVRRLFAEFHLPQPAYVMAVTLIAGVLIGLYAPNHTTISDPDPVDTESFLYPDEGPL